MTPDTGWFTSSHSTAASNNCVEVRLAGCTAAVRDSTRPRAGHLTVPPTAWHAFLHLARRG